MTVCVCLCVCVIVLNTIVAWTLALGRDYKNTDILSAFADTVELHVIFLSVSLHVSRSLSLSPSLHLSPSVF